MAYPIAPVGIISRTPPNEWGLVESYAWGRDYRPDAEHWYRLGVEYIEPLRAFANVMWPVMADMEWEDDGGDWEQAKGDYWTVCKPFGYPAVQHLMMSDGGAYLNSQTADKQHTARALTSWAPNWFLTCQRMPPPFGQGIWPQVVVQMPAEVYAHLEDPDDPGEFVTQWWPAWLSLYLPLRPYGDETPLPSPVLHVMPKDADYPGDGIFYYVNTDGYIVATCDRAGKRSQMEAASGEPSRECVSFQVLEHGEYQGKARHLIKIGLTGADDFWYTAQEGLRVLTSTPHDGETPEGEWQDFAVYVIGHVAAFALGTLAAGAGSVQYATADVPPDDVDLTDLECDVTTGDVPTGWEITAVNEPYKAGGVQVRVSWEPDTYAYGYTADQPTLVYLATADAPAVISNEDDTEPETTEAATRLVALEWTRNRQHKGCTGSARFRPDFDTLYSDWSPNDCLEITAGWDAESDLPAEQQMRGYLLTPVRAVDGERSAGAAEYAIQFGDYVAARMRGHKPCVDMPQAAGRNLADWFRACWERMGIPDTYVDVVLSAESETIPTADLLSDEQFAPRDGTGMEQHLDEVVFACGYRWGVARDGRPFLAEAYTYEHGVSPIAFTLDEETATEEDVLWRVEHERDLSDHVDRFKVTVGRDEQVTELYQGRTLEDRLAGSGDSFEAVVNYEDYRDASASHARLLQEMSERSRRLTWTSIARPDLDGGDYVLVDTAQFVGVEAGTVFQVDTIRNVLAEGLRGECSCTAVVVYEPDEYGS